MDVYYGNNFWGGRSEGEPGRKVRTEKEFTWEGHKCRIPAVYVYERGIVADICIQIPVGEIEVFLRKWAHLEGREERLSDEEREEIGRDNPFSMDFRVQTAINGRKGNSGGMCATGWNPVTCGEEPSSGAEEQLLEEYGCSRDAGWKFVRVSAEYPGEVHEPVASLRFVLCKEPRTYAGPHFWTGAGREGRVEFTHPVTGNKHVLTVQGCEQQVLPEETQSGLRSGRIRCVRSPRHFQVMQYALEPEFPQEELQVHDCAQSDPPVLEKQRGAAAVSVIGGADGPTAIFLAGKGAKPRLHSACSSLHYEPVDEVEWSISFRVKQDCEMEIDVI